MIKLDFALCSGWPEFETCEKCRRYVGQYKFDRDGLYSFIGRGEMPDENCGNFYALKGAAKC